jgi:glycosyltransferase involved in cell wall biosynthesis
MRINWFSPVSPAMTDIAHYTGRVLPSLAARADVVVWTDQDEWDVQLEQRCEVRRYQYENLSDSDRRLLNNADATFYNIGNNPFFHGPLWQVSRQYAGIVILHDVHLQHFFAGLFKCQWNDEAGFRAVMARYYGDAGIEAVDAFWNGRMSTEHLAEHFPLTGLAIENAIGTITHVRQAFDRLSHEDRRPVAYAPLPYPSHVSDAKVAARAANRQTDRPYRIVVFGYLGPNRRLDSILNALAGFSQRDQFRLDVYGKLDKPDQWRRKIRCLGIESLVTIRGFVSEQELDDAVDRAHLGINLRYPTMGEASGTQLRMWDHGLPTLVTNIGWYASLPSDAVAFVRPEHEVADIQRHLRDLLSDPAKFVNMGETGYRILRHDHSPDTYAETVLEFARQTHGYRNRLNASQLVRRSGQLLGEWVSPEEHAPLLQRIASEISRFAA